MKQGVQGRFWTVLAGLFVVGLLLAGCGSNPPARGHGLHGEVTQTNEPPPESEIIHVGDSLSITFSDTPAQFPPSEQRVKSDGTIALPYTQTFMAAGKTRGQLETEIHDRYVPKFVTYITVNIKAQERVYYVGGEVKAPGRQPYLGKLTVLRAIQSCGDFTDFADRKNVKVIRASGRTETVNCNKALKEPRLDLEVYPDDNIIVPRSIF